MSASPTRSALARLDTALSAIPPTSGAVVMGTGIVSIGLALDHRKTLSLILLALAAGIWIALGLVLAARAWRDRPRSLREARSPAALTGVAATAVLASRVTELGWHRWGAALLIIATCLWLTLAAPVLRNWETPTTGVALMTAVSTESLSVLAAALATRDHTPWLLWAALLLFVLGLLLYAWVLARFDFRELLTGHGDHWITGGALAISTLAATRITLAARTTHELTSLIPALKTASIVLWVVSMAWLVPLVAVEALRPRLGYDVRRWATVFPVGMYAACSFDTGVVAGLGAASDFARVWVWVSFGLWCVVLTAMLGTAGQLTRSRSSRASATRVEQLSPSRETTAASE